MKKRVLILSTSPRKDGNSEALADAFLAGAEEAGHEVEKVSLYDRQIAFCRGCLACQRTGKCVIRDGMDGILEKLRGADAVAFATPVYFYGMCGQMKTLLDRTNPVFPADYAFRDIYLLATAADGEESAVDGTVTGLEGWIACFEKTRLAGVVRGVGVTAPGEIHSHPELLSKAREMGRNV